MPPTKNAKPKAKTIKASIPFLLFSIKLSPCNFIFVSFFILKKPLVVIMAKGYYHHTSQFIKV